MRKKFVLILLSLALMTVVAASAASPTTDQAFYLAFYSPNDAFVFQVDKAEEAGDLTVSTRDCCIPGDHWRVDLMPKQPRNAANQVHGIGDGSTSTFSGAATAHPWIRGTVTVSYDSGVDIFPAGMWVRFQYTNPEGTTGVVITQVSSLRTTSLTASASGPNAQE